MFKDITLTNLRIWSLTLYSCSLLATTACIPSIIGQEMGRRMVTEINYSVEKPHVNYLSPDGTKKLFVQSAGGKPAVGIVHSGSGNSMFAGETTQKMEAGDGSILEVLKPSTKGKLQIFVRDERTGQVSNLTGTSSNNGCPSWSPDGKQIVFCSDRDGGSEIYVMNADGSNPRRITSGPDRKYDPVWLPWNKIEFLSYEEGKSGTRSVKIINYHVNPDGSGLEAATECITYPGSTGKVSPDGKRVVYAAVSVLNWEPGNFTDIYVINIDGTGKKKLTTDAFCVDPAWSPDGKKIFFTLDKHGRFIGVYVMNPDGSDLRITKYNTVEAAVASYSARKPEKLLNP